MSIKVQTLQSENLLQKSNNPYKKIKANFIAKKDSKL